MSEDRTWPERWVDCEVVLTDGEVKTHALKASLSLTQYLAAQAGQTGQLILLCGTETICYPLVSIQQWSLKNERDSK